MTPDTIFSEDDGYELSIHVNQIHGAVVLEIKGHQNIWEPILRPL